MTDEWRYPCYCLPGPARCDDDTACDRALGVSENEQLGNAIQALLDICPIHTVDGKAVVDDDCDNCRYRLDAARMYLRQTIEDAEKALGL